MSQRIAVVTGGAQGIGRRVVLDLVAAGYHTAVLDVHDPVRDLNADRQPDDGVPGPDLQLMADVADEDSVQRAFMAIRHRFGAPSVLVSNAGIFPRDDIATMPLARWQRVLDVNLTGSFIAARTFHAVRDPEARGSIVIIGSPLAVKGSPEGTHYASSKAGLGGLMHSLARAWAPDVRVNQVIPGMTDTAQLRQGFPEDAQLALLGRENPMQRLCTPSDVAEAVVFLAGERSSYITGQTLFVNGGEMMT